MPDLATLLLFAGSAATLVLIPGPNLIYIVTRSVESGRRAGLASMLGVETGTLIHVAAAAFGLSALLASSAVAFEIVKYAGVAYLIYLGVRALRAGEAPETQIEAAGMRRTVAEGVLVNVLNPKVSLFFLAFLPQFVDPDKGAAVTQILALGVVFLAIAATLDLLFVLAASRVGERAARASTRSPGERGARASTRFPGERAARSSTRSPGDRLGGRASGRFAGGVYLALAALAAASGGRRS